MIGSLFSREGILSLILSIPGLLIAITFHEIAHGYAAYLMGDRTAKYSGRLSFNPLHHLDLVGTLCMLLFRFGWAKPVPVNPNYFKNKRVGTVLVSLAGPFANFLLGLVSCIAFYLLAGIPGPKNSFVQFIAQVFLYSTYMNTGFMIFNLMPIPPLDGSKIVMEFLPYKLKYQIYKYERYFSLILIIFIYAGTMTPALSWLQGWVLTFYDFVAQSILKLFV